MTQSLILLLRTPRQRRVIACIRPYIPKHHHDAELNWRYVAAAEAEVETAEAEADAVEAEAEEAEA